MKQLQETAATNVANKADFTQCCAMKSVPRYKNGDLWSWISEIPRWAELQSSFA